MIALLCIVGYIVIGLAIYFTSVFWLRDEPSWFPPIELLSMFWIMMIPMTAFLWWVIEAGALRERLLQYVREAPLRARGKELAKGKRIDDYTKTEDISIVRQRDPLLIEAEQEVEQLLERETH